MKKISNIFKLFVVPCLLVCFLVSPSAGQEKKGDTGQQDPMKDFSIIGETQPVPSDLKTGFESITGKDAQAYLAFISSDWLEGRDTGRRGYDIAAEFAGTMFKLWGLKPAGDFPEPVRDFRSFYAPQQPREKAERTYFQEVALKEVVSSDSRITVECRKGSETKSRTFMPDMDYRYRVGQTQTLSAPVVFVGYGISEKKAGYDDYAKIDVKGKIVMMLTEVPGKDDPNSPFAKEELKQKYMPARDFRRRFMPSPKVQLAHDKGAVGVIIVENAPEKALDVPKQTLNARRINDEKPIIPGERARVSLFQSSIRMPWPTLPTINVTGDMADFILGYADQHLEDLKAKIEKNYQPNSFSLPGVFLNVESTVKEKLIRSRNVLGFIEGSDPKLKDEVVVIGAHLDHLGKRGDYIFNGADDNGSGSVGVLEIAQAFALNPVKPKRSILFALWTGEEKGLLGSRYYVSSPFFPTDKTVAYINLDMISREWKKDRLKMMARRFGIGFDDKMLEKVDTSKFITLSLSMSDEIYNALKQNNQYVGMHLHLRKTNQGMGGSDHSSFAFKKVSWVFFMAAMTEDYHQPSDSVEKISTGLIEKISRLCWLTAFSLANK